MKEKDTPEIRFNLPKDFYEFAQQYLENDVKIKTKGELIQLWQKAFESALQHPQRRESIAEWTVSIGSSSSFIHDNDFFEAIHNGFGSLEVEDSYVGADKAKADSEWQKYQELFSVLLNKNRRK